MRKYSVELSSPCFDYEGGDPVMEERPNGDYYEVYQVDTEIARLNSQIASITNERDVAFRLAGHTAPALDAKIRECVLLKSEVSSLQEITDDLQQSCIQKDDYAQVLRDRNDLLKAALRWCLENGAKDALDGTVRDTGCGCCSGMLDIPPEFAAVIAEAVGSKT